VEKKGDMRVSVATNGLQGRSCIIITPAGPRPFGVGKEGEVEKILIRKAKGRLSTTSSRRPKIRPASNQKERRQRGDE